MLFDFFHIKFIKKNWKKSLNPVKLGKFSLGGKFMNKINTQMKERKKKEMESGFWNFFFFMGGIVIPAVTLVVEFTTHICAANYFDPLPTLWHVLLVAFVPLANGYLFYAYKNNKTERATLIGWSSALSVGISFFYSIVFTPLLPISFLVLIFGVGFLSLSPFLALISTLKMRRLFLDMAGDKKNFAFTWRGLLAGLLIIFTIGLIAELPFAITRYGLETAYSTDIEEKERGIRFLRNYGNENYLLRQTYLQKGVTISDMIWNLKYGFKRRNLTEENRKIFYLVKGKTYNELPRPRYVSDFLWEEDSITGRMSRRDRAIRKNITLESSVIDGSIDSEAMLGYVEWTLVFKNSANWQEEAFAQIQLPKDGVVSRLTLWIDGEEREAAFAERRRVKEAYQRVVSRRRDPVLVTTSGKDRINMRCFPIQPDGGQMKLRIGITFPLQMQNKTEGAVILPKFQTRNFVIPENIRHQVWYESKLPLKAGLENYKAEKEGDHFAIRGNLTDGEVGTYKSSIYTNRSGEFETVWSKDEKAVEESSTKIISQKIVEVETEKPSGIVFVVDTNESIKDKKQEIKSVIEKLPADLNIGLVLTNGNGINQQIAYPNSHFGTPLEIIEKLNEVNFVGGTDNLPALNKGWEMAGKNGKGVVFWIHAPQPIIFETPVSNISQKLERRPDKVEIYSVQLGDGLDIIGNELHESGGLNNLNRFGGFEKDVERLLNRKLKAEKTLVFKREALREKDLSTLNKTLKTSDHLARLWAFDEIKSLINDRNINPENEKKAVDLAVKYQLVTPVSGAVVLETKEQYQEAGLKPVDNQTVPTIPEPETYFLIAIVGLFLVFLFFGRKRKVLKLRT